MKNLKFHISVLTVILSGITLFSHAQGLIGSWKKTDEIVLKKNGKTASTFKMLVKNIPCFADIVYTFSAGGKMSERVKDCEILQKRIGSQLENSHWKMTGDKLTIDVFDKTSPVKHAEYQIELVGKDEMIWTFKYSENPGVPNITNAEQMKTTYIRTIE
jgi:hypothetical protein